MPIYTSTSRLFSPLGRTSSSEVLPITNGLFSWHAADSFSGSTWFDKSGNGRNATVTRGSVSLVSTTGNGASKTFNVLQGGINDGVLFPESVLPSTYTLFHITRYQGSSNSRIVTGLGNNWLSGHWGGFSGVAFHEGWLTQSSRTVFSNDWIITSDQNSLYRGNAVTYGSSGGSASTRLSINAGQTTEYSAWQCAEIIVYNRSFSLSEMLQMEEYLAQKYGIQAFSTSSINTSGLVLHMNARNISSYPGTGTTLFDLSSSGLHATGSSALSGQFIAQNQPYTTASTSILNTDIHTILFSIQINGTTGTWDKIFGYEPSGTDRSPGIWRFPSQRYIHWRYDPSNTGADFSASQAGAAGTEFIPNRWYYVGVTKNGATATVYVDGTSFGTQTVSNPKTAGNSTIRIFPAYTGSTSMIRHLHIYNRVLSASEISANYQSVFPEIKYA